MPDGVVDVAELSGLIGKVNEVDPRFEAFVRVDATPEVRSEYYHSSRRRELPYLLGRVLITSVFIGRDGRAWSDEEIAESHTALLRAGRWLENQAIRYDVPLNVSLAKTYFVAELEDDDDEEVEVTFMPRGIGEGPIEAHSVTKALVDMSRAASQLGFENAQTWLAGINPRVEADAYVWILHPLRMGRSFAIPADVSELDGVSLAISYAREANFPEPLLGLPRTDPATIVHELMHLFGAMDKYGVPLSSFPRHQVTSQDVMRLSQSRLSQLRVDPLTAFEVGWGSGRGATVMPFDRRD